MEFFKKIKWRLEFILREGWHKSPLALVYNLFPSGHRWKDSLALRLVKSDPNLKQLVRVTVSSNKEMLLDLGLMKLICNKKYSFSTFVHEYFEIIYPYFTQKNDKLFLSSLINPEGPYEKGGAHLENGDYVIDAGANVGMFSMFISKKIGTNGKVFAFEPVPETRQLLLKNIKLNNFNNIEIIPFALGEQEKKITIFLDPENLQTPSGVFRPGVKQIKIQQISLDEFVNKNKIAKVDFIKADIEGMERNLLRGAEQTIKKFKPKLAFCTYHLMDDPEVLEKIVKSYVPEYRIIKDSNKMYAWTK